MATPFACSFNIFHNIYNCIRLLSSFFIKHCIHHSSFSVHLSLSLSLSVVPHPVFLISGLSLRFGDVDVFFLQSKVCSYAVVPSSDHCRTEIVLSPSDHYCIETVVPSSAHCCNGAVPPSSDHYQTSKVHYSVLKSQVFLLQTAHSWANAGVLLGAHMHRERGNFRNN